MGQIAVEKNVGGIDGLCVLTPARHGDSRGYFMETYHQRDLEEAGLSYSFVQHNQSGSVKGVLRGLHFQKRFPQAKLVRVIRGEVFDVAVDLRRESASFGHWHGELQSDENARQFLIPRGFAHGFLALSDEAEFCYLCDDFYHPDDEGGIRWDDPGLGVRWPGLAKEGNPPRLQDGTLLILSDKDKAWPGFRALFPDR